MALTYGFFNSLNGDRTYNSDQISSMFEGLISDGVFESVDDAFLVTTSSGMVVSVGTGRAFLQDRWVKNDAAISLSISAANVTLPRYTAIILRKDVSLRTISLITVDGTPASNPQKPAITRSGDYYDICLAYVFVPAGATAISQANIVDTRADSTICGWVTALIDQVDTSQLFLQWQTAYEDFYDQMQTWMSDQESSFQTWFEALTEQLQVNTYIEEYHKFVQLAQSDSKVVSLDMSGYTYDASDIIFISLNGLTATETQDYLLNTSVTPVQVHLNLVGSSNMTEDVDIKILKSRIGYFPDAPVAETIAV